MKHYSLGPETKTAKNFPQVLFKDFWEVDCAITADTIILGDRHDRPGTSAVILDIGAYFHADGHVLAKGACTLLSRAQVKGLIAHLSCWLKTGRFESSDENPTTPGQLN